MVPLQHRVKKALSLSSALIASAGLAWFWLGQVPTARAAEKSLDPDEQLLKDARIRPDDATILAWLRASSSNDDDLQNIDCWIHQLGASDFDQREVASRKLTKLGLVAIRKLRDACKAGDEEITRRANDIIHHALKARDGELALPALRWLQNHKSPGVAEAMLRYLPYTIDSQVEEDIYWTLDDLVDKDEKARIQVAACLNDTLPERRALAGCIIGRVGSPTQVASVRLLLADKNPYVRLRSAQGLLASEDKSGIPVLIRLISEARIDISWQADELLHYVAGDDAPAAKLDPSTEQSRKLYQEAWTRWWSLKGDKLDLRQLKEATRRPILVLVSEESEQNGHCSARIMLYGSNGTVRWQLDTIPPIEDIQLLHNNSLLLALKDDNRVIECDLTGNTLWDHTIPVRTPKHVRRLPNGNTAIQWSKGLFEITPDGKDISPVAKGLYSDSNSAKFDCRIVQYIGPHHLLGINRENSILDLYYDDSGNVSTTYERTSAPELRAMRTAHILRSGNLLVSTSHPTVIVELDAQRKITRKYDLKGECLPATVLRDNLIAATDYPVPRIVELNREGRIVWEKLLSTKARCLSSCLELVGIGFGTPRSRNSNVDSTLRQIDNLTSPDKALRLKAILLLRDQGKEAVKAIPALIRFLDDSSQDQQLSIEVITTLGRIDPSNEAVIKSLQKAAKAKSTLVSEAASKTLAHIAKSPK
jgi:HEAT repeat protein